MKNAVRRTIKFSMTSGLKTDSALNRPAQRMIKFMRFVPLLLGVCLAGCSSAPAAKEPKAAAQLPAHVMASNTSDSIAKYVEMVGFRVTERSPGKLIVQFGLVNHSEADIGDVKLNVNLTTTNAKPGDPPLISFPAQVPSLGPSELKNVSVDVPTKMRAYELPDWQFLTATFEITEPK